MARVAASQPSMQHVRFTTGITARSELFDWPFPAGYVVRSSGAQKIKRSLEHPNETAEEKTARKEANQLTQAIGGRLLAKGYNWLIYPEGNSMQIVEENGKKVRIPREPGVMLPLYDGFVYSLENMTDEERRRVKMLGIAVHYGEGALSHFNPTVHIGMPVSPEGTREDWFHQGEEILSHGISEAVRLHELRTG
jgi:1-acyl-sn-glycerol-3-phosphate acyltransferase